MYRTYDYSSNFPRYDNYDRRHHAPNRRDNSTYSGYHASVNYDATDQYDEAYSTSDSMTHYYGYSDERQRGPSSSSLSHRQEQYSRYGVHHKYSSYYPSLSSHTIQNRLSFHDRHNYSEEKRDDEKSYAKSQRKSSTTRDTFKSSSQMKTLVGKKSSRLSSKIVLTKSSRSRSTTKASHSSNNSKSDSSRRKHKSKQRQKARNSSTRSTTTTSTSTSSSKSMSNSPSSARSASTSTSSSRSRSPKSKRKRTKTKNLQDEVDQVDLTRQFVLVDFESAFVRDMTSNCNYSIQLSTSTSTFELDALSEILPLIGSKVTNLNLNDHMNRLNVKQAYLDSYLLKAQINDVMSEQTRQFDLMGRIAVECKSRVNIQLNYLTELDSLFKRLRETNENENNTASIDVKRFQDWLVMSQAELSHAQLSLIKYARRRLADQLNNFMHGFSFYSLISILDKFVDKYASSSIDAH